MFFLDAPLTPNHEVWLDEETAKHVLQVLRMRTGDGLQLTNGKGMMATAFIAAIEKKNCSVFIEHAAVHDVPSPALHLAITFTKNTSRNEWLLEKATELGVRTIIPLIASRSERERIRHDRWNNILTSALIQSQQFHLPVLTEAMPLKRVLETYASDHKLVAHCMPNIRRQPLAEVLMRGKNTLMLIGPEGDFTAEEVNDCIGAGCISTSLGSSRLRTETAAMAACAYFNMVNYEKD